MVCKATPSTQNKVNDNIFFSSETFSTKCLILYHFVLCTWCCFTNKFIRLYNLVSQVTLRSSGTDILYGCHLLRCLYNILYFLWLYNAYLPTLPFCAGVFWHSRKHSRTNDEIPEISPLPVRSHVGVSNLLHSDILTRIRISQDFSLLSIEVNKQWAIIWKLWRVVFMFDL